MRWSGAAEFDSRFLTIWGLATLAVTVLDYLLPAWLARRFGGSKQAARGSLVGLIVGMVFFPPAGLIVGAFVGAFVGELIHDGSDKLRALRVAGQFVRRLHSRYRDEAGRVARDRILRHPRAVRLT